MKKQKDDDERNILNELQFQRDPFKDNLKFLADFFSEAFADPMYGVRPPPVWPKQIYNTG